ncbi:MAG: sialate O-acetylesterase [Mediterranea sp.]|jgi:sialate O-acetylesterase|nr:sialate O-acetylesterase [Mediterranea sp.]
MKKNILLTLLLLGAATIQAKVTLPALMGDNMVLQQQTEVRLWGQATPRSEVRVTPSWNGQTVTTRTDGEGRFLLTVATPAASYTPYSITFDDGSPLTVQNVLIGEVWLASGQSNMEMPLRGFSGCCIEGGVDDIIASVDQKGVRMFNVPRRQSFEEQTECDGNWMLPSVATAADFSATAYYFAVSASKALGIPVGIINCSYGGSAVESWINRATLENYPDIPTTREAIEKIEPTWERPLLMYNGMLKPTQNYTIRGIIWYQGETNVGRHQTYAQRLADMVALWRSEWGLGDIPFYFAEIAPYDYDSNTQHNKAAFLREAQFRAQSLIANSAMISTNDLVEPYERFNIHPRRKREVGRRLSYLALNLTYGMSQIHCFSPQYKSLTLDGDKALIALDHLEMGICRNYDLQGFEVAGADRRFYPADSVFIRWEVNLVEVQSARVPKPVAVRYCFKDFQVGTLIGGNELPLIPFRTDDWEE